MPQAITDCHAHLTSPEFTDLPDVLSAAAAAGVRRVICVSEQVDDARQVLELARRFSSVAPCVGLHPEFADL
ncbi:MAG: TatD family hydrolase, partial [Myxococcales bacterium]|nr:TatD family hydrolase [Myxococcales bacterium]